MFIIIPYTIVIIAEIDWQHLSVNEEFTRNQLRRCNVPPNHRPACSSISQQRCHPRAGHDSSGIRVNCRLIHSQGDINSKPITAGFHRLSTDKPSQHSPRFNHCMPAAKQIHSLLCDEGINNRVSTPNQKKTQLSLLSSLELVLALTWPKQLSCNPHQGASAATTHHKG